VSLTESVVSFFTERHDGLRVVLAVVLCMLAAKTGFQALRFHLAAPQSEIAWASIASLAFGLGIWSTHFSAMLGYRPDLVLGFTQSSIAASFAVALVGIGPALVMGARSVTARGRAIWAGVAALMTGLMHNIGVLGLTDCAPALGPLETVLGVVLAAGLFTVALRALRLTTGGNVLAALPLTLGVGALHFVSVAGVTLGALDDAVGAVASGARVENGFIAAAVAGIALIIGAMLLVAHGQRVNGRLEGIARASQDGMLVISARGTGEWANPAFERLTGLCIKGRTKTDPLRALAALHRDDDVTEALRAGLAEGRRVEAVVRIATVAGVRWLELTLSPVAGPSGARDGAALALHDITDTRAREVALRTAQKSQAQATARLAAAVERLPVGVAMFDSDSRLLICNDAYRTLTPGGETVLKPGVHIDDLKHTAEEAGHPVLEIGEGDPAQSTLVGGLRATECEFRLPDGRWVLRQFLFCENGESIVLRRDVTRRKIEEIEMRAALERAEVASRAKSEFISVMSHELRTPLNGVLGFAAILGATDLTEQQRKCVDRVAESGEALLRILTDILDAAALENNQLVLDEAPTDPRALVAQVTVAHAGRAAAKGLQLDTDVAADVPEEIMADGPRLRQMLDALVDNAVKFTAAGSVAVKVGTDGERRLQIRVSDTGPGIADEDRAGLFDPFSQVDSSATRRHGGVGLGLANCARLARLMGGRLTVDSTVGRGTTVTLSVKLRLAPPRKRPQRRFGVA
jgi:PAS domain S-box-containing protein